MTESIANQRKSKPLHQTLKENIVNPPGPDTPRSRPNGSAYDCLTGQILELDYLTCTHRTSYFVKPWAVVKMCSMTRHMAVVGSHGSYRRRNTLKTPHQISTTVTPRTLFSFCSGHRPTSLLNLLRYSRIPTRNHLLDPQLERCLSQTSCQSLIAISRASGC
jgi:hypothetical protein